MAERKVKIVAIIDAESGDYNESLTSVQGKTTIFGNVVQGIFQGIGQAIYRHFVGGLIDAGKKMVSIIGDSIGKAADLEYALAEVSTLGVRDMEKMRRGVLDLSYAIGEDAVQVTKALYQAISAGVPEENVLTFIKTASKGAVAGLTETEVMVNALTTVLEAYNLEWEEAGRVSDLLFTTVKYGKTEMSLLAPVIGRVAALAKQAGMGLEEMFTWLARSTHFLKTEEAITGLRTALQAFIKPTGESVKVLKELNLTWEQMQKTVAEEGIAKFLSRLTDNQLPRFLGSQEAIISALTVLGSDPGLREFNKVLQEMGKSAGATGTAFGQMMDSFNKQWDLLKKRITTAQTEIAGPFMEIGKEIVKSVNQWLDTPGPDGRTPIQAFSQWADRVRARVIADLDLVAKGEKTWGEIIAAWIDDSTAGVREAIKDFAQSKFYNEFKTFMAAEWEKVKPSMLALAEEIGMEIVKGIAKGIWAGATYPARALVGVVEDAISQALASTQREYQESMYGPASTWTRPPATIELPAGIGTQESPWGGSTPTSTPTLTPAKKALEETAKAADELNKEFDDLGDSAQENFLKIGDQAYTLENLGLDDAAESAAKMEKELTDLGLVQEGYYKIVCEGVETVGKLDDAISGIDTSPLQENIEETLAGTTNAVEAYMGSVFWTDFAASFSDGWERIKWSVLGSADQQGREIIEAIANSISAGSSVVAAAVGSVISSAMATASYMTYEGETEEEDSGWKGSFTGAKQAATVQGGNITFNIYDARDADQVAEKVARKIKELERLGRFSLAPELTR